MRNRWTLPVAQGNKPEDFLAKLESQLTAIRSATVDNSNSTLNVMVYAGNSPHGTPYPVLAGRAATIAISQSSSVYFQFQFANTAVNPPGVIYVSVSDEDAEDFPPYWLGINAIAEGLELPVSGDLEIDTSTPLNTVVTNTPLPIQGASTGTPVSVTGQVHVDTTLPLNAVVTNTPLPVQGDVTVSSGTLPLNTAVTNTPLPVSGNVGVSGVVASQLTGPFPLQVDLGPTTANATPLAVSPNPVLYPPPGAGTRINQFSVLSFNSTTAAVQLLSQPVGGTAAFFTVIYLWGLNAQPTIEWILQGRNSVGGQNPLLRGWGDKTLNFSGPYFMALNANVNAGIFFTFANQNAIIGTLQVRVALMGWWGSP